MIYEKNALVLVNTGNATRQELSDAISFIQNEVQKKFDITIEPEPVIL
jgi:UDP-N-acetylenolpyruvoylglucosamine reductase